MASLLLTSRSVEDISFSDTVMSGDGKVCPSPMSTFGSDFNDNLFLQASNAHNFERTDYKEFPSETTNNQQRLTEPEHVEMINNKDDEDDNVEEDDQTEDADDDTGTILNIAIFATNVRKSDIQSEMDKYCIKVKSKVNIQKHRKNGVKNAKKEKRRNISAEFSFLNVSLFPRPCHNPTDTSDRALEQYHAAEQSLDDFEDLVAPYNKELEMEGKCAKLAKYTHCDRDRKIKKAHIQVKDKYCTSVRNNHGRKRFYIHHRVFKLMHLELQRYSYMPSRRRGRLGIKCEEMTEIRRAANTAVRPVNNRPQHRSPAQNLAYAIDNNNAAQDLDNALVNLLITLQQRDITPEDYETLLQLDESVAPKTLEQNVLESFRTDTVNESCVNDTCAICMEQYTLGQPRKFLPCNHVFHTNCIDMWLNNSSLNCPIDNLPVDGSNS
ncbi:uncharacterized protein LOC110458251 [Mizuhopecten yessoensis]|uniref:E3 ubiquitin ligase BIG BROTHER n=1 Tax=Mizuhopecten yessoensis TaxID=6573 RepID=A0A210Q719_MIZYE|nr:uncharacterized protein LOC110458251 [Mizuhopecten yessoensis]OWF44537.1 E3 ubiquitin ligase BIG BROTHER [Mizuhopecten yessoensis]